MNTDDSFNDSDEVLSLYSSKSIKETFKAQLKKIVATSNHPTSASKDEEKEKIRCEKDKIHEDNIQEKLTNLPERITETNEDVTFSKVTEERSLDNSIEIVEDVTITPTRYSERLRKRKGNSCQAVRKPAADRRKPKSRKRRKKGKNSIEEITLDDSLEGLDYEDDLNPEISVKVIWKSVNVKRFYIRKFQKLSCLYELLAKEEGLPQEKIVLKFNNTRVNPNDTPDSLNLQVYHFLDGGVINESSNLYLISESKISESDANSITIKFQDVDKKVIEVNVNKSEKLKIGMIKCSEQLNVPLQRIKFFFDGDLLNPSETPETLGLENGEVIDIKVTG